MWNLNDHPTPEELFDLFGDLVPECFKEETK